jgi:hypothetical protein
VDLGTVHLVNAKSTSDLVLDLAHPMGGVEVTVFDTQGNVVDRHRRTLGASIHLFQAPPSGRVEIQQR